MIATHGHDFGSMLPDVLAWAGSSAKISWFLGFDRRCLRDFLGFSEALWSSCEDCTLDGTIAEVGLEKRPPMAAMRKKKNRYEIGNSFSIWFDEKLQVHSRVPAECIISHY